MQCFALREGDTEEADLEERPGVWGAVGTVGSQGHWGAGENCWRELLVTNAVSAQAAGESSRRALRLPATFMSHTVYSV